MNGTGLWPVIEMPRGFVHVVVLAAVTLITCTPLVSQGSAISTCTTHEVVEWEPFVERHDVVESLDMLATERNVERLEVRIQVLDLAAADDGEHVGGLLHQVRDRD